MHFNAGPWVRLMRELPLGRLLVVGVVGLGSSVAALYLALGPLRFLRPILPLFAFAGGIGGAALLAFTFRLVWAGGRKVRSAAAVILGAALLCGAVRWYSVSVVRRAAWRACAEASRVSDPERRAAAVAEGRALTAGFFYRVSRVFESDRGAEDACDFADTDEVRKARGLCPRVIEGETPCRCGSRAFPRDITRDAFCTRVGCDARSGYIDLACEPASAPSAVPSAATAPHLDGWAARLGLDDLVKIEPVRLDNDYALRVTRRGAAPDDLEAMRASCRALFDRASPYLATERPPLLIAPTGDHVALILAWEDGPARAVTSFDARLGKMTTVIESDGAVLQDRKDYAFEIDPATEVSFNPGKSVVCKGPVLNLTDKPLDLTVACEIKDIGNKHPPRNGAREKLSLTPHGKGTYEVHPPNDEGVLFQHVFREKGGEAPLAPFNRLAHGHAKDWIALHTRLRRSPGVHFHNPYPSLPAEHKEYGTPALSLPEGWADFDAKKRDEAAKEIWKAMSAHYRRYHQSGVTTVDLYAGKDKTWRIEEGKLARNAP